MPSMLEELELKELIQKLIDNGFGELVDAFLENEHDVTTKKGRLNKSGLGRVLNWKSKQIEETLVQARLLLEKDIDWEAQEQVDDDDE